jgi:hypothetical protein
MRTILVVLLVLAPITSAVAQHAPGPAEPGHRSPYRDQHAAGARGLTAQEIGDLAAGRGMGLARAAELNGYPGPRHVLDAARDRQLVLSDDQWMAVQRVFDTMEQEARKLGARVIAEEQALEAAFRAGAITEDDLASRVSRLATTQGDLRQVHLRAHLATRALLTETQIARYHELRGYTSPAPAPADAHRPQGHRH